MPFAIVAENCTGCSACEKRCPTKAITGDPKKAYYIEALQCIDCGACGAVCPDDAILDTYGNVTKVLKRQDRPIAIVHPDNCNGCGVCIDVCPFDCIEPSAENTANYLGRVGCKLCEEVCGWEGIYVMPGKEKQPFLESLGYEILADAG